MGGFSDMVADFDSATLLSSLSVEGPLPDGELWREGDPAGELILLSCGTCSLWADTHFGRNQIVTVEGPCLIGLVEFGTSPFRLCRAGVANALTLARISPEKARELATLEGRTGKAFRRLALITVERLLRGCQENLKSFFVPEPGESNAPRRLSGQFERVERPLQPTEVRELSKSSGLSFSGLMDLGLIKRSFPGGSKLAKYGTRGDEAFFIYSGRVRMSVRLPGTGEEALTILNPGELAGEMALFDEGPRMVDLIAHEGPVEAFVFNRTTLLQIFDGSIPGSGRLLYTILGALSRRLAEAIERSISFYVMSGGSLAGSTGSLPEWSEDEARGTSGEGFCEIEGPGNKPD